MTHSPPARLSIQPHQPFEARAMQHPSNGKSSVLSPAPRRTLLQAAGFYCALALVFLRFSFLHETITFLTGVNTYLLYVFTPLALIAVVASRGLERTFQAPTARWWLVFVTWMALVTPFSSWTGGSAADFFAYLRTVFPMLLVISGTARSWSDCRKVLSVIGIATILNLATANLFMNAAADGRLSLEWGGAIANSNDLAAHLLLVLPIVLFFVLAPRTAVVVRIGAAAVFVYGLLEVLRTASRGGLVAIAISMTYVLVTGSGRQKATILVLGPLGLAALIAILPQATWNRLTSFSDHSNASEEALESSEARSYLLKQSIVYTFQRPLTGVGPGQFSLYEGATVTKQGGRGNWHETHNTYTQISSECGIPALLFYLGALITTFRMLQRIRKKAKAEHNSEIMTAVFCLSLGLVAYSSAVFFLSFAYRFYMLSISSLTIALAYAVDKQEPNSQRRRPSILKAVAKSEPLAVR